MKEILTPWEGANVRTNGTFLRRRHDKMYIHFPLDILSLFIHLGKPKECKGLNAFIGQLLILPSAGL